MAVAQQIGVTQRPWRGYDDPGLPVGMWIAQQVSLGDASGGTNTISLLFQSEIDALSARYYNLEQIEAHIAIGAAADVSLLITNLDVLGPAGLVTRAYTLELLDNPSDLPGLIVQQGALPIFLGRPTIAAVPATIQLVSNNTNGSTLVLTAQGYIWEPRSLMAEGGLRRPVDSLYG